MDLALINKLADRGNDIYMNPQHLYKYNDIINGVVIDKDKSPMKAVEDNTFQGFSYKDADMYKAMEIYDDYFINNKNNILNALKDISTIDSLNELEMNIYKDICGILRYYPSLYRRAESFNRVRKPIILYVEHIVAMAEEISNLDRQRLVPFLFLAIDSYIIDSPFIFTESEINQWGLKKSTVDYKGKKIKGSSFGLIKKKSIFDSMERVALLRAKDYSCKIDKPFYRIYFDILWGNRINSDGRSLFLSNSTKKRC